MTNYGFVKVATAVYDIRIGNVIENCKNIVRCMDDARMENVSLLVFPELCLTGYSCQDMFFNRSLLDDVETALIKIAEANYSMTCVIGAPILNNGKLYNCAVVFDGPRIVAVIPKTYIPNNGEFYEKRWFTSAIDVMSDSISFGPKQTDIPFGTNIICEGPNGVRLACEICEDLWVNIPPSSIHTAYGANIIANPSASNDIIAKKEYRKDLVRMQSAKCECVYVYASAGSGESTTDVVYSGHQIIASCGSIFNEGETMMCDNSKPTIVSAVVDLERIEHDRMTNNSFNVSSIPKNYRRVSLEFSSCGVAVKPDYVNPYPFILSNKKQRNERCMEILKLQATGLATRLKKTGIHKCVIGISGGLDSTLALLVIKEAYDMLGYSYKDIVGITMPGFGTTKRTKSSANTLMELMGITSKTVDITKSCLQHMEDIGHPIDVYDVTYENIQARERTQILMDVANQVGGLVIGTGDLSELALGWCTYNGDHMSMYAVNVSVPKTLVKFIIKTYAETENQILHDVLIDICKTTINPELLPPDENGEIKQSTEQSIGKYDLHDFFLYNYIRNGFSPRKLGVLAKIAFADLGISDEQIEDTLHTFVTRFVTNQFKRNCMPDGPKIGSVSLSPRGDWRMSSDFG